MNTALIPHPELSLLPFIKPQPELTDEVLATRLAAAYDDGAYMVLQRLSLALTLGGEFMEFRRALDRRFAPTYVEIRDFLQHEHNVAPVLAARVAMRIAAVSVAPWRASS